jgi:XTP/dITP diphosphohydrolase
MVAGVDRLVEVMHTLRSGCPWDAEQTHESLVRYLLEETLEVVDAIEAGSQADLVEELGDLLLQVVFHSEIAAGQGRFDLDEVASGIADKLVARHPYVFADAGVPEDLMGSWEQRKQAEKGRASVLDGIPAQMSALARGAKVIGRVAAHGGDVAALLPESGDDLGERILALVAEAHARGIDADQATRDAVRALEARVLEVEATAEDGGGTPV